MNFWSTTRGPLLYAHRGASRERPENTVEAFERALDLGADVLELDVHATRDGVVVVSHDPTGDRTCGVPRRLAESSWLEVRTWDAGWGFTDERGMRPFAERGVRLVRFDELLERFPSAALNVDVKEASASLARRMVTTIRSAHAEMRVLLTSFSGRALGLLHGAGYAGPLGLSRNDVMRLLFGPTLLGRLLPLRGARAQIPPRFGCFDLSKPRCIERVHGAGLAVDYWVINDAALAALLLERGADGIMTDDPASIAEVFRIAPRAAAFRERHPPSPSS